MDRSHIVEYHLAFHQYRIIRFLILYVVAVIDIS